MSQVFRKLVCCLRGLPRNHLRLFDLCVWTAIDNVKYIGYVGGVDFQLLEQILQHCTLEQLMHIEDSTHYTDLSPITNKFWKRFYQKQYGEKNLNNVVERMKREKSRFLLEAIIRGKTYTHDFAQAKLKVLQEAENEASDRLKQLYKNEDARNSASGYNISHVKSNIMKKAKLDVLKSQEVKNLTAIKRNTVQKSFSISAPKRTCLSATAPSTSRSIPFNGRNLTAIQMNTIQESCSISAPKRTGLSANAPSTSRSIPLGGRNLPPKRVNSLRGTAPNKNI